MGVCRAVSASYAQIIDMLYVLCKEGGSLSRCHSIEDTPSGITVMYDEDGSVIGAEISDFSERYDIPASILVDSSNPFMLSVDKADGLAVA